MAGVGVWGTIPQAEGVAQAAVQALERVNSNQSFHPKSDTSSIGTSDGLNKDRSGEEIATLARKLTQHSIKNSDGTYPNPFQGTDDPALNPRSDQFKPEVWTRTLLG